MDVSQQALVSLRPDLDNQRPPEFGLSPLMGARSGQSDVTVFDDVWVLPTVPRWGRLPGVRVEVRARFVGPLPSTSKHLEIIALDRAARMPVDSWTRFPFPVLGGDEFEFSVRIPGDFASADLGSGRLVLPEDLDPSKRIEIRVHRLFLGFGYTRGSESVVAVEHGVAP